MFKINIFIKQKRNQVKTPFFTAARNIILYKVCNNAKIQRHLWREMMLWFWLKCRQFNSTGPTASRLLHHFLICHCHQPSIIGIVWNCQKSSVYHIWMYYRKWMSSIHLNENCSLSNKLVLHCRSWSCDTHITFLGLGKVLQILNVWVD